MEITSYDTKVGFYSPPDSALNHKGMNTSRTDTAVLKLNKEEAAIYKMLEKIFLGPNTK